MLADFPTQDELLERCAVARLPIDGTLPPELRLYRQVDLSIYFAPLDHVNADARVVIIGITPGLQQARNALIEFQRSVRAGASRDQALRAAKSTASFSGPMRRNLVAMLDFFRVNELLRVPSCGMLFEEGNQLAHFTSMLSHPVFWHGRNYNGVPNPMKHPVLRNFVNTRLLSELEALPHALLVPLGSTVNRIIGELARNGRLSADRILDGLEHPSGANIERIQYLLNRKPREALSRNTNAARIDAARARLLEKVAALRSRGDPGSTSIETPAR